MSGIQRIYRAISLWTRRAVFPASDVKLYGNVLATSGDFVLKTEPDSI